ncbi:MAG: NAD(P)-dependent oxidoreductase, partial [Sphingobacteriales bacterium]
MCCPAREKQKAECLRANAEGPALLAELCKKYSVSFLTFSSDLVFDGEKGAPYVESDKVNPLNTYGLSKAESEARILEKNSDAIVIRTSSFFGPWDKYNFVYTTLRSLEEGKPLSVAGDVFVSPTYVPDLVNVSLDLLVDDEKGIWHLANHGELTWADLAYEVADRFGLNRKYLNATTNEEMNYPAKRPLYSV